MFVRAGEQLDSEGGREVEREKRGRERELCVRAHVYVCVRASMCVRVCRNERACVGMCVRTCACTSTKNNRSAPVYMFNSVQVTDWKTRGQFTNPRPAMFVFP